MKKSSKNKAISTKKIVLFSPKPASNAFFEGAPISLLSISRLLDAEGGYDIKIISATSKYDYSQTILSMMDGAICFGISSMTGYQIQDGLDVAMAVKKKYPNVPIVWGGWHPSICPDQTIRNSNVDIVVRGQGERTFMEIVHKLENRSPLNNVAGTSYKHNGKIFHNLDRPFEDINNFPPLPYHLVNMEDYIRVSEYGSRTIDYISSIGCPHRCAFCSDRLINKGRWSGLSPKRVVDDLKLLVNKYGINTIFFQDSNFFVDEERVKKICQGIIKNNLQLRLGQLDARTSQLVRYHKNTWRLMKKSGVVSLLVGAESGSQQVLDFIHKDANVEDTIKTAAICKSYGIGIVLSLMLGLPYAKGKFDQSIKDEFKQTALMINKIKATGVDLNICGWFVYTPYPGTPLHKISIKRGWRSPKTLKGWAQFGLTSKNTPWITKKYVDLLRQLNEYIFPCMGTTYIRAWENKQKTTIFRSFYISLALLTLNILKMTASFRWKHNFFSFPIENRLIKFYSDNIKE